jgi:hypothetical protein
MILILSIEQKEIKSIQLNYSTGWAKVAFIE